MMKKIMLLALTVILMLGTVACTLDQERTINDTGTADSTGTTETTIGGEMTYKLTDTGQSTSYDEEGNVISPSEGNAFYGQDADYTGTQPSFTDNGDGTITDNVTGLIWQQIPISQNMSYDEAIAYCETLELGGYGDWRLPTAKELFGLSDFSEGWPYLDQDYFEFPEASQGPQPPAGGEGEDGPPPNGPGGGRPQGGPHTGNATDNTMPPPTDQSTDTTMPPPPPPGGNPTDTTMPPTVNDDGVDGGIGKDQGQFWTSNFYEVGTTHNGAPSAFGVNHATGHIKAYPSDVTGPMGKFVRAVRGTVNTNNNFVDNGDGTISDLSTGLMWLKDDNGQGVEWEEALEYCENLEYAGYDDWRLPDVKELQSIVDYSGTYPAIDPEYFTCTELVENEFYYFWTSTSAYFSPAEPGNYYAWYVAFGYAVDDEGNDTHGAGAVRFSAKYANSPAAQEGGDNFYNSVRAVRTINQ